MAVDKLTTEVNVTETQAEIAQVEVARDKGASAGDDRDVKAKEQAAESSGTGKKEYVTQVDRPIVG